MRHCDPSSPLTSEARTDDTTPTRTAEHVLDITVLTLAVWTGIYQVALAMDWSRDAAIVVWIVASAGATVALTATACPPATGPSSRMQRPAGSRRVLSVLIASVAATLAVTTRGTGSRWWAFWAVLVGALAVGVVMRVRVREPSTEAADTTTHGGWLVVALALFLALASACVQRPDLDDVFVVNRAVYVEQHQTLTTRDTLFSDSRVSGGRPALRSPTFEPLIGAIAALTPLGAASVGYLAVAPLISALSVLANWLLLRLFVPRIAHVAVAVTVMFLVLDGGRRASFGNFSFGRAWQGKVVLVALIVPLLWYKALKWVMAPSVRSWILLVGVNVAAAGLSSTGYLIAPAVTGLVTLAGAIASRRPPFFVMGMLASTYPLVLAVLNAGTDESLTTEQASAAPLVAPWGRWERVFSSPTAAIVAVALVTSWLVVRRRVASLALCLAPLVVVLFLYGPRAIDPLRVLVPGSAAILWRAIWIIPVPALVGLVIASPLVSAHRRGQVAAGVLIAFSAGMLLGFGHPVPSTENDGATIGLPSWDAAGERDIARRLIALADTGETIAGPVEVERMVPLLTSRVYAVDPRPGRYYPPGMDPAPRNRMQRILTEGLGREDEAQFLTDLRALNVAAVALPARLRSDSVYDTLLASDFVTAATPGAWVLLDRR